ncbi:MAG: YdeI family protein, partial [Bacteroidia bacterium]
TRQEWRDWLIENHESDGAIWLRTPHKASGLERVPYDDVVEEALCFGWVDGLAKKYDDVSAVQRFTPRRKRTFLSELNRQRMFKMMRLGLMTDAGIAPVADQLGSPDDPLVIPEDILVQIQSDEEAWDNWQKSPLIYRKIRIGYVMECRKSRPEDSQKRLNNLIKKTADNKMFGTMVE